MHSNTDFNAIAELDLEAIKVKLMHAASGEGWTLERANAIEAEYRRFLILMKKYPNEQTAPLVDVDTFWHYYILDTLKYAADCEARIRLLPAPLSLHRPARRSRRGSPRAPRPAHEGTVPNHLWRRIRRQRRGVLGRRHAGSVFGHGRRQHHRLLRRDRRPGRRTLRGRRFRTNRLLRRGLGQGRLLRHGHARRVLRRASAPGRDRLRHLHSDSNRGCQAALFLRFISAT